jgi:hypothetical protein
VPSTSIHALVRGEPDLGRLAGMVIGAIASSTGCRSARKAAGLSSSPCCTTFATAMSDGSIV